MRTPPGAECIFLLMRLREMLVSGVLQGPIVGNIRDGEVRHPFVIRDAADIEVLEELKAAHVPPVRIRGGPGGDILVVPEEPFTVRVGKDGAGKPIFLTELE